MNSDVSSTKDSTFALVEFAMPFTCMKYIFKGIPQDWRIAFFVLYSDATLSLNRYTDLII